MLRQVHQGYSNILFYFVVSVKGYPWSIHWKRHVPLKKMLKRGMVSLSLLDCWFGYRKCNNLQDPCRASTEVSFEK